MIGIDIVQISRIKDAQKLAKRILSDEELLFLEKRVNKNEFIAGHFAAKEAFLKAHHLGIGAIVLKEIAILYENSGAPYILYKDNKYDVSIAHDGDYAIAVCNL